MDRISGLPDEVLVKILTLVETKVAVSTSILSKRWEFLWMWLPKLEYSTCDYSESECKRLQCFLHRNLPLHRAPVLESFCLKFRDPHFKPEDIKLWVLAVVSRCIRELKISYTFYPNEPDILPSSLYICQSLVTLKLRGPIPVDVPRMVCLPCLKTLQLRNVTYLNEDSLQRLLSNCPVLEDLMVDEREVANLRKIIVTVSSLLRLALCVPNNLDELVINTPSVRYFKIQHYNWKSHYKCLIEKMPKLREASVEVLFPSIKRLIGSITSAKRLTLCVAQNSLEADVYGDGFVFNQLQNLKLCICERKVSSVLVQLLKDSPKLRSLDLFVMEDHGEVGMDSWDEPGSVPQCMLSSLKTFRWSGYLGRPLERDLATYILKTARRLKTATIFADPYLFPKLDMIKELALSPRASTACQLEFV